MPDTITDIEILNLIQQEFKEKGAVATAQYLEIHEPVYEQGVLKIVLLILIKEIANAGQYIWAISLKPVTTLYTIKMKPVP